MVISINGPSFFSGDSVKNLVVMLHGRGANGDNMISLAPQMSKELPATQFLAPHAHMSYGGGYTWFSDSVRDMEESTAFVEIMQAVEIVNEFIDVQQDRFSIGDSELSLVGFSQGAMLAIYVGLCRAQKCASIVAYSGAIPFPHALATKIRSKPGVCVVHGTDDHVIPIHYFDECVSFLRSQGVPTVEHKLQDLDHSINSDGARIGTKFIKDNFATS
ncbi:putative esterase [Anaplasma centrale str. Israel]|uniref:Putative esterase n=1 Tax=Anaplasma centrale (strain Israel) TaxID=574556 RepID=D1ASP9_ANACI|nr:dienelactone hydrolase family protein [Anaplasma centrale]ACZ49502.1 putative esterase [Anaplasma centrale str. Israel]